MEGGKSAVSVKTAKANLPQRGPSQAAPQGYTGVKTQCLESRVWFLDF